MHGHAGRWWLGFVIARRLGVGHVVLLGAMRRGLRVVLGVLVFSPFNSRPPTKGGGG